jgi:hypothetical protein
MEPHRAVAAFFVRARAVSCFVYAASPGDAARV